ncbi:MAG: hypothetical protein QXX92_08360 [Candidatus Bathyarchaeia archaeon]
MKRKEVSTVTLRHAVSEARYGIDSVSYQSVYQSSYATLYNKLIKIVD